MPMTIANNHNHEKDKGPLGNGINQSRTKTLPIKYPNLKIKSSARISLD